MNETALTVLFCCWSFWWTLRTLYARMYLGDYNNTVFFLLCFVLHRMRFSFFVSCQFSVVAVCLFFGCSLSVEYVPNLFFGLFNSIKKQWWRLWNCEYDRRLTGCVCDTPCLLFSLQLDIFFPLSCCNGVPSTQFANKMELFFFPLHRCHDTALRTPIWLYHQHKQMYMVTGGIFWLSNHIEF